MKKVLQDEVIHTVKVTRIKGHGYGVRVLLNGEVNQEALATSRQEIGIVAKQLLRMEDKCGNLSDFAHSARHRAGKKESAVKKAA